jgi:hypothetical protein
MKNIQQRKLKTISYNCPNSDKARLLRDLKKAGFYRTGDDMLVRVYTEPNGEGEEVVSFLQFHKGQWVLRAVDGILSPA